MKQLYILGAGGFDRELHSYVLRHLDHGVAWTSAGFLDDNPDALQPFARFAPATPLSGHQPDPNGVYLCGFGQPATKSRLMEPLLEVKVSFMTFVHPFVLIWERVRLGRGVGFSWGSFAGEI